MRQKSQKLTICLISKFKDFAGVWEVVVEIKGKPYTFAIASEFAVRTAECLIAQHKPGKALNLLKQFALKETR